MRESSPTGSNFKILTLAIAYFFVFGLSNVSYFLPLYYNRVGGISPREAGMIVSIFYITSVFSRPFLAYVLTNLGFRKLFLLAGGMFVAGSSCMALFGVSFWVAVLSRAVLGLASSLFKIGFSTYQALAFNESERGRAYSLIMVGELLPLMTIAPLADWLIQRGLSGHYILIPVLMCVASVVATLVIPGMGDIQLEEKNAKTAKNPFYGMGDCLRTPSFRMALLSTFLFSMTDATASFMASMTASFGLMASLFLSSNALVGVCARIFSSSLLDKFSRQTLAVPTILLTSSALMLASVNPTPRTLPILGLVFGLGMGFGFPLHLALAADSVPAERQPQAVAITWFTIGINFSIVPLLMGYFQELTGPVFIFRSISGFAFAGACFLGLSLWRPGLQRQQAK